jgi:hypothetical protein
MVSQSDITRKITRAQVLNGVQSSITLPSGSLLGRISVGVGQPEVISVGANLLLSGGTISATATPFMIGALPAGNVPAGGDLLSMSQAGTNVAVTYGQFLSGVPGVPNIDLSQGLVTPTGGTGSEKLADLAASILSVSGGTLSGTLTLSGNPTSPAQAANKAYVDQKVATALPLAGGSLAGPLTLAAAPVNPLDSATKGYTDSVAAGLLPLSGGSLSGSLVLHTDPTSSQQAVTKNYADLKLSRSGDTMTGALVLVSDPTSALQAATKNYVDSQFGGALSKTGGTLVGSLVLAADPTLNAQAATKQYVDQRVLRAGDTLTGALTLAGDPVLGTQAATKNYVDTQLGGTVPRAGSSMSGALLLASDPAVALQASTKQYVDLRIFRNGDTLTGPLVLASDPTSPLQAATKQYIDRQLSTSITSAGGTFTGPVVLAGNPTLPTQAATKSYVDANPNAERVTNVTLPPYGAKLDGVTDDTAAFKAAYVAAAPGSSIYVPNGTTVLQQPSTWGVALTKYVKWVVDGTALANGTSLAAAIPGGGNPATFVLPGFVSGNTSTGLSVSKGSSQITDFAVNQSCYVVNHNGGVNGTVAANTRSDTIIYDSPGNYIWNGLDRLLWCGIQTPDANNPAQHVARYVQAVRYSTGTQSGGQPPLPQPQVWAACLEYRDATGSPSSATGASLSVEMDWFGNGLDDANNRAIQSLVIGQSDTSGAPVEVSSIIGVYLSAGSTGSAKTVFSVNIPFSDAVLDTTYAHSIGNAPAIKLAAGQAIAFESTNTNQLLYNDVTGILTWNQGTLSYPVGKGISVGSKNVYSSSSTLQSNTAGNIILLSGTSAFTITLPPAVTLAAGTGFTFSVIGSAPVSLALYGTDSVDCGPITLRTNDRYHIVSDGTSKWHEVFRTNAVSPQFGAPPVLPSYTVGSLPTAGVAGAMAFASNGRKPTDPAGAGTGVMAVYDGQKWTSSCSGTAVSA